MEWTNSIPLISDGENVEASVANRSAIALSERTAALQETLSAIQSGQQIVLRNAPVTAETALGNVLYLDVNTLLHAPAISGWQDLNEQEGGTLLPLDSSVFTGVVLRKCSGTTADILMGGVGQLDVVGLDNLFGTSTPETGIHYLSTNTAGTVSADRLGPSVRVVQYAGDGIIRVFPYTYEPVTHQHYCYRIATGDWTLASSFPDAPVSATYGVNFTTANSISEGTANAIIAGAGEGAFTNVTSGTKDLSGDYFSDASGIWTTSVGLPSDEMEYCVTIADTKDMAVLHTISTQTVQALSIANNNGNVTVDSVEYGSTTGNAGYEVVKGIDFDNHKLILGNIVEQVLAGPGIFLTASAGDGQGVIQLSASLYNNLRLTADVVNLNNAVTSVEGTLVVTKYPTSRTSTVNYTVQLPEIGDADFNARIWVQALSPGSSQDAPDVEYVLIPSPDAAGVTPDAAVVSDLGTFPASVTAGDVYYLETADIDLTGYSGGTIAFTLSADTPSPEFNLISAGVIIADGNI
jgi:hypothetical protein